MLGIWPLTRVCLKQTDTQKHQLDSDELSAKGKKLLKEGKFEEALARYDEAIDCFNQSLEIEPRDKKAS